MLEIIINTIVLVMLAIAGLAKHGKGRRSRRDFSNYIKGTIDHTLSLGTLGPNALVGTDIADVLEEAAYLSSIRATWALDSFTLAEDAGPILVGVAHSDYTDAEIEAWVEQTTGWARGDKISREIAGRFCRRVGVLSPVTSISAVTLNDGKPITTKCGWNLTTGQTLRVWAYNVGGAALSATVPDVHCNGYANLWSKS